MKLNELYNFAERKNIPVISFDMPLSESMSVLCSGDCYIGIDPMKLHSETEEKEKLAHELGHCVTGAFYNEYSAYDIREKHERRAKKWSIENLIPREEFFAALKDCFCANRFELAEHFNVSEDFMQMAMDYYFKD